VRGEKSLPAWSPLRGKTPETVFQAREGGKLHQKRTVPHLPPAKGKGRNEKAYWEKGGSGATSNGKRGDDLNEPKAGNNFWTLTQAAPMKE